MSVALSVFSVRSRQTTEQAPWSHFGEKFQPIVKFPRLFVNPCCEVVFALTLKFPVTRAAERGGTGTSTWVEARSDSRTPSPRVTTSYMKILPGNTL